MKNVTRLALAAALLAAAAACSDATGPRYPTDSQPGTSDPKSGGGGGDAFLAPATAPVAIYA